MTLKIGEVIRNLRKEKKLTQENLSKYLGVSYQTISKWENGTAYPDITLLPSIANFFNVSIDILFNQNKIDSNLQIDKIYNEYCWSNKEDAEQKLREILKNHPSNFKIMQALLNVLCKKNNNCNIDEVIEMGSRIIEGSSDDKIKWFTMQSLVFLFIKIGKKEEALELINRFPPSMCGEDLLFKFYTGDEKTKHCAIMKERSALRLWNVYNFLINTSIYEKDFEKAISYIDTFINLMELLYKDDELIFVDLLILFIIKKVKIYIEMSDSLNAVNSLKEAIEYVKNKSNEMYTKNKLIELLINNFNEAKYEVIQNNEEYKSIISNFTHTQVT